MYEVFDKSKIRYILTLIALIQIGLMSTFYGNVALNLLRNHKNQYNQRQNSITFKNFVQSLFLIRNWLFIAQASKK